MRKTPEGIMKAWSEIVTKQPGLKAEHIAQKLLKIEPRWVRWLYCKKPKNVLSEESIDVIEKAKTHLKASEKLKAALVIHDPKYELDLRRIAVLKYRHNRDAGFNRFYSSRSIGYWHHSKMGAITLGRWIQENLNRVGRSTHNAWDGKRHLDRMCASAPKQLILNSTIAALDTIDASKLDKSLANLSMTFTKIL
jgi:hypothetical protein